MMSFLRTTEPSQEVSPILGSEASAREVIISAAVCSVTA